MTEPHPYADWDAAYVLGALSVSERHAFEDHLAGCPDCRTAVNQLAAMPGLLAQLPADEAQALNDEGSSTPTDPSVDLPQAIRAMSPPRRAGRWLLVAVAVLALLIGGVTGYLVRASVQPEPVPTPSAAPTPTRVAFSPVGSSAMIAVADLAPVGAGTVIDVECHYPPSNNYPGSVQYALYVIDNYGNRNRSAVWSAAPGARVTQQMRSELPLTKINALEIVYADSGTPVVRAPV